MSFFEIILDPSKYDHKEKFSISMENYAFSVAHFHSLSLIYFAPLLFIFIFKKFYFISEYSWLIMACSFQVYSKVTLNKVNYIS